MAKTSFFNYKLEKISLDKSQADNASTYKQFEFTSLTFKREKWLAQRLLFVCVLFSILFKAVNFNCALSFILISSIFFYAQLYFIVKKEKVLYIPSVGFQETTTYANGRTVNRFHDIKRVNDLIINEVVSMYQVTCYLSLVCKSEKTDDLYLENLFFNIQPKLDVLETIYSELKPILNK